MSFTDIIRFGNIRCQFDHFGTGIFEDTWKWQLDPYRTFSNSVLPVQLVIQNADTKATVSDVLLWEETSGFFSRQVFRNAIGGTNWIYIRNRKNEIYLQYTVSPEWDRISLQVDHTQTAGHLAFVYLGQIFPYCALKNNMITFHGVLMEYQGHGIIISAPSGIGKTTHARLWRDYRNALIINGDRASCYIKDGTWIGCGLPWSGTSGEQINRSVPLKALVVLERGERNEAHRITGLEAFGTVLPHLQYPAWDKEMVNKAMEKLDQFLSEIPIIRFCCRPDLESVDVLYQALEKL